MKHKESIVRVVSYFVIICLLSGMINSTISGSTIKLSFFSKQLDTQEEIKNASCTGQSSDILQMIQQVNASILKTYIQKIQEFGPHPTGSKACEAVGKYLYDKLNSFQLSVRYDPWKYKLRSGKNIEATLQGKEDCNCIFFVSAHYDSVAVSPGANDDGSGVAVVLAAADIMSHYSFNSTIRFVLFSGEEQGLLGSHEYVQNVFRKNEHVIGNLQLDGVGYAVTSEDGSKIKHHANNQSAWIVDISKTIASTYHNEIGLEVIRRPHVTFSDHESFVHYNYDASYLWQYTQSPYYHTSEDTLEHMNITYLAKICKLTVGTLASIAELHPHLSKDDIKISMRGQALTHPGQFCIRIENKKSQVDSANVTINIAMKNLRTGQYVFMRIDTNNITCNWTFTKEIKIFWEFKTIGRRYSSQIISIEVIVKGIKDDVLLYTTQRTTGVIIARFIFLIPKQ
jgi:aminopeptidase YwaD